MPWVLVLGLLAWNAGAAAPAPDCRPGSVGVREIRAVATGIVAADNRSDIERVLAYYAADAVLMPRASPP